MQKNPEQSLLEQPGPVDAEKVEEEVRETKERMQKKTEAPESESVLDKKLKKGETMDVAAQETRIEKSGEDKDKQAAEIRKEVAEELRKNPVRLTNEEVFDISKKAANEQIKGILDGLSDKGKDMYPDKASVNEAREKMLQNMVKNKVVSEAEKQVFCGKGAFYEFLGKEYDAGGIRLAGWREIIKEAFWGIPIVQQINFFRNMGDGELLVAPRLNGKKELVSLEGFKKLVEGADMDFKLRVEGVGWQEKLKALAEKEESEIQKQVIEKLEKQEQLAGQAEKQEAEEKAGQLIKAKIEEEKSMPEDEKKEKVKQAAILWDKTYEIDRALRRKRKSFDNFKYKKINKDGEEKLFEGEEAKKQAKKDKNAMSKELVALADEISGEERTIMQRAADIQKKWKKRELEDYITKQVMATIEGEGIKFVKDDFAEADSEKMDVNIGFEQTYKELSDPKIKELIERIREQAKNFPTIRALEKSLTVGAPIGFHGAEAAERFSKLMGELPDKGGLKKRIINLLKQEKRKEKKTKNKK